MAVSISNVCINIRDSAAEVAAAKMTLDSSFVCGSLGECVWEWGCTPCHQKYVLTVPPTTRTMSYLTTYMKTTNLLSLLDGELERTTEQHNPIRNRLAKQIAKARQAQFTFVHSSYI